ncbi:CARDB domain-containing protein [Candidatus Altiarchaeota archaeon]
MPFSQRSARMAGAMMLVFCMTCVSAEWSLRFTERDTEESKPYSKYTDLDVLVNGQKIPSAHWDISGLYHLGDTTVDLSPYVKDGDTVSIRYTKESGFGVMILYDIGILHDGAPVKFTAWEETSSHPSAKATIVSDTRITMNLNKFGLPAGGYAEITSQPLDSNIAELVLPQSGLEFDKRIYLIEPGDDVGISVKVGNKGTLTEPSAVIELYADDKLLKRSEKMQVPAGGTASTTFKYKYQAGKVKIEARVLPSDPLKEGRTDNNNAVKYIIGQHPYLYFTDFSKTPAARHANTQPYTSWMKEVSVYSGRYINKDYSSPKQNEVLRCREAKRLALQYHITGEEKYAKKAMEALSNLGSGSWTYLDRSQEGDGQTDQNYGWSYQFPGYTDYSDLLIECSHAYDWSAEYIKDHDKAQGTDNTMKIRDALYRLTADAFHAMQEGYAVDEGSRGTCCDQKIGMHGDQMATRTSITSALGVAATVLLDYDGRYQDEGSAHDMLSWIMRHYFNESLTGEIKPHMSNDLTADGLYEEGVYKSYWVARFISFINAYYDALGVNLARENRQVGGFLNEEIWALAPTGAMPNRCASWQNVWQFQYVTPRLFTGDELAAHNWYVRESLLENKEGYRSGESTYGYLERMVTYDVNAPHRPYSPNGEASRSSPRGSYTILRSGHEESDLWMWLYSVEEGIVGGHSAFQAHQLSFDIWAYGANLITDSGDPRWMKEGQAFAKGPAGHNFYLIEVDGKNVGLQRSMGSSSYRIGNPSVVNEVLYSEVLDFAEGSLLWDKWRPQSTSMYGDTLEDPISVVRDVLLVEDDYFIVADFLDSGVVRNHSMIIHFGGTEAEDRGTPKPDDNYVKGDLYMGGKKVRWYDEVRNVPVWGNASGVTDIVWSSFSDTNKKKPDADRVSMNVNVNPAGYARTHASIMHNGGYCGATCHTEFYKPYALIRQEGDLVRFITVYYPTIEGEDRPEITSVKVTGGDGNEHATMIDAGGKIDLIATSDGKVVTAGKLTTNARLSFLREVNDKLAYFFMREGTGLKYDDRTLLQSEGKITATVIFGSQGIKALINADEPTTLYIGEDYASIGIVEFNGRPISYEHDGRIVRAGIPGSGELMITFGGDKPAREEIEVPKMKEMPRPVIPKKEVKQSTVKQTIAEEIPAIKEAIKKGIKRTAEERPSPLTIMIAFIVLMLVLVLGFYFGKSFR